MKTYYRDSYGCTASIQPRRDGTARLVIRDPIGRVVVRRPYVSDTGAKRAMNRFGDGWKKTGEGV